MCLLPLASKEMTPRSNRMSWKDADSICINWIYFLCQMTFCGVRTAKNLGSQETLLFTGTWVSLHAKICAWVETGQILGNPFKANYTFFNAGYIPSKLFYFFTCQQNPGKTHVRFLQEKKVAQRHGKLLEDCQQQSLIPSSNTCNWKPETALFYKDCVFQHLTVIIQNNYNGGQMTTYWVIVFLSVDCNWLLHIWM